MTKGRPVPFSAKCKRRWKWIALSAKQLRQREQHHNAVSSLVEQRVASLETARISDLVQELREWALSARRRSSGTGERV